MSFGEFFRQGRLTFSSNWNRTSNETKLVLAAAGCGSVFFFVWPRFQNRFEYTLLKDFHRVLGPEFLAYKSNLFADMENCPRNSEGELVILELGIGSGQNLEFYPKKSHLIASDIHNLGEETIKEKCNSSDLTLKSYLVARAEALCQIPNSSVSAVVTTFTTCSFSDCITAYKEIKRVLIPGGKYYFLEHTKEFRGKVSQKLIQLLAMPIQLPLFNCYNSRNQQRDIENVFGEGNVDAHKLFCPIECWDLLLLSVRSMVYGTAIKGIK